MDECGFEHPLLEVARRQSQRGSQRERELVATRRKENTHIILDGTRRHRYAVMEVALFEHNPIDESVNIAMGPGPDSQTKTTIPEDVPTAVLKKAKRKNHRGGKKNRKKKEKLKHNALVAEHRDAVRANREEAHARSQDDCLAAGDTEKPLLVEEFTLASTHDECNDSDKGEEIGNLHLEKITSPDSMGEVAVSNSRDMVVAPPDLCEQDLGRSTKTAEENDTSIDYVVGASVQDSQDDLLSLIVKVAPVENSQRILVNGEQEITETFDHKSEEYDSEIIQADRTTKEKVAISQENDDGSQADVVDDAAAESKSEGEDTRNTDKEDGRTVRDEQVLPTSPDTTFFSEISSVIHKLSAHSITGSPDSHNDTGSVCFADLDSNISTTSTRTTTELDIVASDTFYNVRHSPGKGLGLFATRRIPKGTRILAEEALVLFPEMSFECIVPEVAALNPTQRATFRSLHSQEDPILAEMLQLVESQTPPDMKSGLSIDEQVAAHTIVMSNSHAAGGKSGIFPTASRINHSCVPNVYHSWNESLQALTVHAIRDIEESEELLTTYIALCIGRDQRNDEDHLGRYGFECACQACDEQSPFGRSSATRRTKMVRLAKRAEEDPNPKKALIAAKLMVTLMETEGIMNMELAYW